MIFVTVGVGISEEIVRKVDEIAPRLKDKVFVLLGETRYEPKNCDFVRSVKSIVPYVKNSRLVISHGGAGTLFECLHNGARVVAIAKKHADDHQKDIIEKLAEDGYIIKCGNISELEKCIHSKVKLKKYVKPACNIPKIILGFLKQ